MDGKQEPLQNWRQRMWNTTNTIFATPPVCVFCFFAILVVVVCAGCFKSFCNWPDRYTSAGFYVSLLGFTYVLFELLRAKRIAEVAQENYDHAANVMRTQHYKFCLDEVHNAFEAALNELANKQWTYASKRLNDLSRHLIYVQSIRTHADQRWSEFSEASAYWASEFGKGSNGKHHNYDGDKWLEASHALRECIAAERHDLQPIARRFR